MPYKVEKTVNLDGSPYQGAEVDIVAVDGSQSLGRTTTDVNGLFSVNVGEYSNEVFASVYISGIRPQVKRFTPEEIAVLFGTVKQFGSLPSSMPSVPPSLQNNATSASNGGLFAAAVRLDTGTAVVWASPFDSDNNKTVPVGAQSNVISVSCGTYHTMALKADGTVVCWGRNTSGQCNVPASLANVIEISGGNNFSLALKGDKTLVNWGSTGQGQGNIPSLAQGFTDKISVGDFHCLALVGDGCVAWGYNTNGQCNVPVSAQSGVIDVFAGDRHSMALKADGTVVCWGQNANGQCNVPTNLTNVRAIGGGSSFSYAVKTDNTFVVWGALNNPPSSTTGQPFSLDGNSGWGVFIEELI